VELKKHKKVIFLSYTLLLSWIAHYMSVVVVVEEVVVVHLTLIMK
jgi:hypothetical protein